MLKQAPISKGEVDLDEDAEVRVWAFRETWRLRVGESGGVDGGGGGGGGLLRRVVCRVQMCVAMDTRLASLLCRHHCVGIGVKLGWVGLGWVGLGWVGLGWAWLGWSGLFCCT